MKSLIMPSIILLFLGISSQAKSDPSTPPVHSDWRTQCAEKLNQPDDGASFNVSLYNKAHSLLAREYFPAVRNELPSQLLYTTLSGTQPPVSISCSATESDYADTTVRMCDDKSWPSVDQGLDVRPKEVVVGNGWIMILAEDKYIGLISGLPTRTTADVIGARIDSDSPLWQLVLPSQQSSVYYFTFSPSSEHKITLGTRDPASLGAPSFLFPISRLCIGVTKGFAPTYSLAPSTENKASD
jgi:hypothetical protein